MSASKRGVAEPAPLSAESSSALRAFAEAPTALERLTALRRLFTAKQMAAVRRQPEYKSSLDWCADAARAEGGRSEAERLHALAVLVVVRSARASLDESPPEEAIRAAVAAPIPAIELLADTEDQARVLAALRDFETPWLLDYALPRVINEAAKSNVRREALEAVFARAEAVPRAFELLAAQLELHASKLASPAFTRLAVLILGDALEVVRSRAVSSSNEAPAASLVRFAELLRARGIADLATAESASAVDALARLTLALCAGRLRWALDPSSYRALGVLRSALHRHWPVLGVKARELEPLRVLVAEALYVQARAGVPDGALRDALEGLYGHDADFAARLRMIAQEPGVSESMARWLRGDAELPAAAAGVESVNAEGERDLVCEIAAAVAGVEDHRFDHPDAQDVPAGLVDKLVQASSLLVARRRLRVAARRGDVLSFDPLRHELVRVPERGVTLVRVLTPLVVEDRDDRVIVARKAIVEPFTPEAQG
ncbi:MAG: hypothetical protein U0324_37115 [Polyangiales bacterium]